MEGTSTELQDDDFTEAYTQLTLYNLIMNIFVLVILLKICLLNRFLFVEHNCSIIICHIFINKKNGYF